MVTHDSAAQARSVGGINLLLGLWLLVSPWVFGYRDDPGALWNSVIVGILIGVLAATRASRSVSARFAPGLSWATAILGFWTIISPWTFDYVANAGGRWDNVLLGLCVAALAIWRETALSVEHQNPPPGATAH